MLEITQSFKIANGKAKNVALITMFSTFAVSQEFSDNRFS